MSCLARLAVFCQVSSLLAFMLSKSIFNDHISVQLRVLFTCKTIINCLTKVVEIDKVIKAFSLHKHKIIIIIIAVCSLLAVCVAEPRDGRLALLDAVSFYALFFFFLLPKGLWEKRRREHPACCVIVAAADLSSFKAVCQYRSLHADGESPWPKPTGQEGAGAALKLVFFPSFFSLSPLPPPPPPSIPPL